LTVVTCSSARRRRLSRKESGREIPADEKVLVDLWHWKDDYVQPIQRIAPSRIAIDRIAAVYDLQAKKFVQLADETMENISPSNDGSYAIGADNRKYRTISDYDPGFTDYYLINTAGRFAQTTINKTT
jgi:hypothetical protein